MRSLDILTPMRPKPDAGRAPASDETGVAAAGDFEAMLDSFEGGKAPAEQAEAAEKIEASAPEAPAAIDAGTSLTPAIDPASSALKALMALASPVASAAPPAPAAAPAAGLAAMVQRAAARAAATPTPVSEPPAPQVSVLGLETHFAPVRPLLPATVPAVPASTGANDASVVPTPPIISQAGGAGAAPAARAGAQMGAAAQETAAAEVPMPLQRPAPSLRHGTEAVLAPAPQASSGAATRNAASFPAPATEGAANSPTPVPPALNPTDAPAAAPAQTDPVSLHTVSVLSEAAPARPVSDAPNTEPPILDRPFPETAQAEAAADATHPAVSVPAQPAPTGEARNRIAETTSAPAGNRAVGPRPAEASPIPAGPTQPPTASIPAQAAGAATVQTVATLGRAAFRSDRPGAGTATGSGSPPPTEPEEAAAASGSSAPAQSTAPEQALHATPPHAERPTDIAQSNPMPEGIATPMWGEAETGASEPRRLETPVADPVTPGAADSSPTSASMPTPTALPATPQRQIVDAVTAQLTAVAPAPQARPTALPAEAGPLKILTLQLQPAELGTVLVRMRLQDGRLEMNLRTSREETAERLRKEGGLLSGLLREAGYQADAVTIEAGGAGSAGDFSSRGQGAASFQAPAGGQRDRQPGEAAPDHSGRRPSPQRDEAALPTEEKDHETVSRGRDRGGLYL
ncbi:flagellar hook-length control protein FliK [Methylorubrum zatmanii]